MRPDPAGGRRGGFTLLEVLLTMAIVVPAAVALGGAFNSSLQSWTAVSAAQSLGASGSWAIQKMTRDLRQAVDVRSVGADVLSVGTQYVENSTPDLEVVTWRRTSAGILTRQVASQAAVTYSTGVTAFASRGPTLWARLESPADVLAPALGPPGAQTGNPVFAAGLFGNAVTLSASGQSVAYPATVLDASEGCVELWVDLLRLPAAGTHCLIDTSRSGSQELLWTLAGGTARLTVTWAGVRILAYTPSPVARRFVHLALAWDSQGKRLGGAATAALYLDGQRVAAYNGALATGPFAGSLYVGSSNAPASPGGQQAAVPIDDVRVYNVAKTSFSGRFSEGDLAPVGVTLALAGVASSVSLSAGELPGGLRPGAMSGTLGTQGIFKYVLQGQGSIDWTGCLATCRTVGYIHSDGAFVPGALVVSGGTVDSGSVEKLPVPDLARYKAIATTIHNGNFTFLDSRTYNGVHYVTGNAFVGSGTTVNGSVISEKGVYKRIATLNGTRIAATTAGYPSIVAMAAGNGPDSIDFSGSRGCTFTGLVYGANGVNFYGALNTTITGAVLSGRPVRPMQFGAAGNCSVTYSMATTPPFFSLP